MDVNGTGMQPVAPTRLTTATATTPTTSTSTSTTTAPTPTATTPPVVRPQTKSRTSFFDIFLSEKTIKRNQKHVEIMAALKTYKAVEKRLIEINKNLDELIELLTTATGGKTKSLLSAAADGAGDAISSYHMLLENLNSGNATQNLTDAEIQNFHQHSSAANEKFKALRALYRKTSNISEELKIKVKNIVGDSEKIVELHKLMTRKYPVIKPLKVQSQQSQRVNVDGVDHGDGETTDDEL